MTVSVTLVLSDKEYKVLNSLSNEGGLSNTAVLRQALRMYQYLHERAKAGETFHLSGDKARAVEFVGIGFGP